MGCVNGKPDINDVHANVFQVINVDDQGYQGYTSKLEVSDQHLVLHQRGKQAIRWPLRCLRRYGFDAELFSFESGRRCPTGPGIYAFKCRRAEALFNMLQLQIQNITEESASRDVLPPQLIGDEQVGPVAQSDTSSLQANSIVEGYLEPLPRRRPPLIHHNSISGGMGVGVTIIGDGGIGGLREGVSRGSIRSPASPPTPLSPTTESFYINSEVIDNVTRTDIRDNHVPGTPSHGLNTPPATPTETVQQITYINTINSSVAFQNHAPSANTNGERVVPNIVRSAERSDSISYSLSERLSLNNTDRPLTYSTMPAVRSISYNSYNTLNVDVDTNYARLDDLNRYPNHDYMNVVPENPHRKLVRDRVYININGHHKDDMPAIPPRTSRTAGSAGSGSSHSGTTTTTNTDTEREPQNPAINYIVLDIRDGSDSSQATPMSPGSTSVASGPESPHRGEGYATIDFEKTEGLRQAAALRDTDGSRKTRHNPGLLVRHNSSLSD